MSDTRLPAPKGCGPAGRALWRAVTGEYDLDAHTVVLLTRAVQVADRIAELEEDIKAAGPEGRYVQSVHGLKPHPAIVEARLQTSQLGQLIAALRLEDDGKAPARGFYAAGQSAAVVPLGRDRGHRRRSA